MLERLAASLYASLDLPDPASTRDIAMAALNRTQSDPRFVRILARALLDGELPAQLQSSFPLVTRLRAGLPNDSVDVRAALAEGLALSLGVAVFGPWLCAALELDPNTLDATRDTALERLLTRLDPPATGASL